MCMYYSIYLNIKVLMRVRVNRDREGYFIDASFLAPELQLLCTMMRSIRISEGLRKLRRIVTKSPFSTKPSSTRTSSALVSQEGYSAKNPWKQQPDPNGTQQTYYWNTETNETTQLGSPRPQHWVEVADPAGSNLTYWWNPETNATTPLGEAKPHMFQPTVVAVSNTSIRPFGIRGGLDANPQQYQQLQPPSFGKTMVTYVVLGMGMTFGMVMVRAILGF